MGTKTDRNWEKRLKKTKRALQQVSPTFCAAKWQQLTLHLQHGHTHSCHHPPAHKIPLEELAQDSGALHNTEFKKEQRQTMLRGERPAECGFCWEAEDSSDAYSDRVIKSADEWASDDFPALAAQENPNPSYLEVSFGNGCNMSCMYCSPDISSSIWNEYQKFGPYPVEDSMPLEWYAEVGKKPYRSWEENPYLSAFKDWLPRIISDLHVLRVTGGEPLMNPQTFKMMEWMQDSNPNPKLDFSINTNLMVKRESIQRAARGMEQLVKSATVKKARLYTSVDTHGARAQYVRHGMDYPTLMREAHAFLKTAPHVGLTFIVTHNFFSLFDFELLLKDILDMKKAHIREIEPIPRVMMDLTFLRAPAFMSSLLAPAKLRQGFSRAVDFIEANAESRQRPWGFNAYERNKAHRLQALLVNETLGDRKKVAQLRQDLVNFLRAYDERKGVDSRKVFPELVSLLKTWDKSSKS